MIDKKKLANEVVLTVFYDLDRSTQGSISGEMSDALKTDDANRILEIVSALIFGEKCPESENDHIASFVPKSMTLMIAGKSGEEYISEWDRLSKLVEGTPWDYTDVVLDENGNAVRDENGEMIRKGKDSEKKRNQSNRTIRNSKILKTAK